MKGKLQIAVLFGGYSPEYEVSLQSTSTVIQHMDREKFVPVPIGITRQGDWYHFNGDTEEIARDTWHTAGNCTPFSLPLGRTSPLPFDAAFPVLHGQNGEDGTVQGLFKLMGIPFYMFGQALNPIIRSDGSPKFAMASTLAWAAVNIALDPAFIFVFRWGMMGAAVATILGQVLTAGLAVWYLCHMRAVRLERQSFRVHGKLVRKYIPLGICSFLSQISLVMAMAAIQNMTLKYSALDPIFGQEQYTQIPMTVLGIVMKFFQIVISIAVGLAAGCIPVVGYNIGAGRKDRAKALFTRLLVAEATVGAAALLIVELFPRQLIGIFGAANESVYYTQYAVKCFRVYLCMTVLATVNKGTFIYLQSLGKAFASTAISLVREVVFGVGFALLLPTWFGLNGVLYSMPVSDVLTFLICAVVIVYTYRTLGSGRPSGESFYAK